MKRGSLVRIGKGRKVYQVVRYDNGLCRLAADAKHPDAAKRVPDGLRAYPEHELTEVTKP